MFFLCTVFFSEVLDSLIRGYDDRLPCDNLILEINSSRYAYNLSVKEVNFLVVKAMLTIPVHSATAETNSKELLVKVKQLLLYFLPILQNYIRNAEAQKDCLQSLEVRY